MSESKDEPARRSRRRWLLAVLGTAGLVGGALGLGTFTFVYAEGGSYLSNDPQACANCHVMNREFDAWPKSTHHAVAVCNDCHAPHGSLAGKYYVKAVNGWNHSWAFTTGRFHEPIRITDFNRRVTEQTCRDCHQPIVAAIDTHTAGRPASADEPLACIRCHDDVGHPD